MKEEIIQCEINKLKISVVLEEHEKSLKTLKHDHLDFKMQSNEQRKIIESLRRRNTLVIFGFDEVSEENYGLLESDILDLCNKLLKVQLARSDLSYLRKLKRKMR